MNRLRQAIGRRIAAFLTTPVEAPASLPLDILALRHVLRPADVILVEGNLRVSAVIKYLTQSTWSHAILYIGDGECVEADMIAGVRRFPLADLAHSHVRICRPIGLTADDQAAIVAFAVERLGMQYDLRHVFDLARYLVPLPVPRRWRRRMIAYGSGAPSRAICSTLVAQAFQTVGYPILPEIVHPAETSGAKRKVQEIYHIRDSGLFVPRDFDISPFFHIIKPDTPRRFDHHTLIWVE